MQARAAFRESTSTSDRKIKVLVIDDSAIIRGFISKWIEAEADLELVGVGVNGIDGLTRATKLLPDVIILDIEMPQMDGIEALPLLLKAVPGVKIIMASAISTAGAQITIKALSLGATDYIAKPDARANGTDDYRRDLVAKLRAFGVRKSSLLQRPAPAAPQLSQRTVTTAPAPAPASNIPQRAVGKFARPQALFIGSSTGGPEALKTLITGLAGKLNIPIFITQHMPALFTSTLAEHLTKTTGASVVEVSHNMIPKPGVFHLAQGGKHMILAKAGAGVKIELNENAPENFCRPAVDPLFRSAAEIYGDKALAVILTGMGHDGRDGAKIMAAKGSLILAQDEASSVVWGMPGAVANAGIANAIKPINSLATVILDILRGVAP